MAQTISPMPHETAAPRGKPAARFLGLMIGGGALLGVLAGLAWFTRADALFLELASAALAMCF